MGDRESEQIGEVQKGMVMSEHTIGMNVLSRTSLVLRSLSVSSQKLSSRRLLLLISD